MVKIMDLHSNRFFDIQSSGEFCFLLDFLFLTHSRIAILLIIYLIFFLIYQILFVFFSFSLDHGGNVNRISHSIPQRDSFFSVDVEQVDEWYHSLRAFIDILYEEAVYFKTDPGAQIKTIKRYIMSSIGVNLK